MKNRQNHTLEEKEKIVKNRVSMAIAELEAAEAFMEDTRLVLARPRIRLLISELLTTSQFLDILSEDNL